MKPTIRIGDRLIGSEHPPFVICEISANHNGDLDRALKLIEAAAATGADAIKLQTYTADTLTIDSELPDFRIEGGLWDGRTLYDLYQEAHTPYEWHAALFRRARELGVTIFSTPFDETAVELLESLDAPCYKIASFEVVDLALIARAARTGKPLIISTGLANLGEIEEAVATARANGTGGVALLHCTSAYPAPIEDANLRTIAHLSDSFGVPAGLSDHTPGVTAPVAAVALGASLIEKHFTLSRNDPGPDSAFSLEPDEFSDLVSSCKAAHKALGTISYDLLGSERGSFKFRRSLYVVADVRKGEPLAGKLRSIRPGFGLAPKHLDAAAAGRATRDLKRGERLDWSMVESIER